MQIPPFPPDIDRTFLVAVSNKNLGLNRGAVNTFCENVASCRFLSLLLHIFLLLCRFLSLFVASFRFLQIAYLALFIQKINREKRGLATFLQQK
jgi:hypothetical protein